MKSKFYAFLILNFSVAVTLFSQQGQLDMGFGVNGIVKHSFDTTFLSYNEAHALVIQPDGKIVVGGRSAQRMVITRFVADGTLDASFGDAGVVFIEYTWLAADRINELAIQPDGKIVAIVQSYYFDPDIQIEWGNTIIMRFLPNGMFDEDFDYQTGYADHGTAFIETGHDIVQGKSIILQPDGKILIGGIVRNEFGNFQHVFIARCNPDGALDSGFANNGIAIIDIGNHSTYLKDLLLQPDGKIIFSGKIVANISSLQSVFFVARLTNDGALDNGFGDSGVLSDSLPSSNHYAQELMLQEDGNILAWINKDWFAAPMLDVIRIKPNGSFDTIFGTNGVLTISTDSIPYVTKILADDEGCYYLAGYKKEEIQFGNGPGDFALTKLRQDFTAVQEFGNEGVVLNDINNGTNDRVAAAALLPNNKIILAGYASTIYYEAKLTLAQYFGRDTTVTTDTVPPPDSLILNEEGLTILPNPVGENFSLCYPLSELSIITIELYDSSGRLLHVFLEKAVRNAGMNCEEFNWPSDVEKGVYFVTLSGRKFAYSGKIIKS